MARPRARQRPAQGVRRAGTRVRGYDYVHSVVDDHSRLAYSEILPDEQADTVVAFWARAHAFFTAHGVTIERVLTDNGPAYRSNAFNAVPAGQGAKHKYTRRYRPQTNGKVERFNRILLEESAYVRTYTSGKTRGAALKTWLHRYNSIAATPHSAGSHRQPCHQGPTSYS